MDSELACNILHMCPLKWQDQYHLLEKCYLEGVKPLLLILECIEDAHPVNEANAVVKPAKSQGTEQPSKKFVQGTQNPRKPKYAHTENACVKTFYLCKKHGDMHTMHNTAECCPYKKEGTPTRGISSKAGRSGNNWNSQKSYAQVMAHMEKLEKSLKKAKKGKKFCCHKESDSNPDYS